MSFTVYKVCSGPKGISGHFIIDENARVRHWELNMHGVDNEEGGIADCGNIAPPQMMVMGEAFALFKNSRMQWGRMKRGFRALRDRAF